MSVYQQSLSGEDVRLVVVCCDALEMGNGLRQLAVIVDANPGAFLLTVTIETDHDDEDRIKLTGYLTFVGCHPETDVELPECAS